MCGREMHLCHVLCFRSHREISALKMAFPNKNLLRDYLALYVHVYRQV